MAAKTKMAVIGCGAIGNIHADAYKACAEADLAAVADIIPERAKALAARLGVPCAVADYHDILSDKSIQAVSVCVPNDLHCPITLDCLRAGKHVLCEKPIALSVKQALAMQAEARRRRRLLVIGVVNRFNVYVQRLKSAIAAGELGEVYHVQTVFKQFRSIPGMGGWFTTKEHSGGGVMIDWAVHFLDLILFCLDHPKPRRVSGVAHARLARDMKKYTFLSMWGGPPDYNGVCDVEEYISALVRTNGPTIALEGAWAQNVDQNAMYIEFLGDKGGVRLQYGGQYTLYWEKDGALLQTVTNLPQRNMYNDEMAAFVHCVHHSKPSIADISTVLPSQRIIDAFYESAKKGVEVAVR